VDKAIRAGTLPFTRTEVQFYKLPKMSKKINARHRRIAVTLAALACLWLGVLLPAGEQAGSTLKLVFYSLKN
jgi:hypothetical protein